jgi:CheY-like chemotaxis protein
MTPEQMGRLFQVFSQVDPSSKRKASGCGLGLALSQKLSDMMGGRITVESTPGEGSTFTLRLPAEVTKARAGAPPAPPTEQSVQARGTPTGRNTVLVADDDPATRDVLTRWLSAQGYHVVPVARGEDVLETARQVRPQAITLDVMMPGTDGWAVLSVLKADPELADIPVIMLTIVEDSNLGHALGAADYLTKPLDRERLLRVLEKYCRTSSGATALVVEDDAAMREMLRRFLEKSNWVVAEASNGREALQFVARQQPALILLDLMMPEVDGFEVLTELNRHPEWRSIPVVVVTAKDLTEEDRLFLNASLLLSGRSSGVLQKGGLSREDLLRQVRDLVPAAPQPAREAAVSFPA